MTYQWTYLAVNLFMAQSSRTYLSHTLTYEQQIKHLHDTKLECYCTQGKCKTASLFLHCIPYV